MANYSVCGINCDECRFKTEQNCTGCKAIQGKVFWGDCELYRCNAEKSQEHCGKCREFPCAKLKEWASSENPERIDNLRNLQNSCGSEIPDGVEKLMDLARKKVSENCAVGSQAIVMETANNLLHCRVIANATVDGRPGEMALIDEIKTSGYTEVRRIVCMWHDGTVDLPSYNLRKALIELNPINEESLILLNGGIHYAAKALKTTM